MFLGRGPVVFRLSAEGKAVFSGVSENSSILAVSVVMQDDHGVWVSLDNAESDAQLNQLALVKWSHFDTAVMELPPLAPRRVPVGFKSS
jgi:hypothetical protein